MFSQKFKLVLENYFSNVKISLCNNFSPVLTSSNSSNFNVSFDNSSITIKNSTAYTFPDLSSQILVNSFILTNSAGEELFRARLSYTRNLLPGDSVVIKESALVIRINVT